VFKFDQNQAIELYDSTGKQQDTFKAEVLNPVDKITHAVMYVDEDGTHRSVLEQGYRPLSLTKTASSFSPTLTRPWSVRTETAQAKN